jgi:hypothetical protein
VIGGRLDRPHTLGHECFVRTDEQVPVQRLLVIRTARVTAENPPATAENGYAAPPLACQAAYSTARGTSR